MCYIYFYIIHFSLVSDYTYQCIGEICKNNICLQYVVFYYNFTWKDYGDATLQGLLDMVKVLAFAVNEGRVAIHCHAGKA